MLFKKGFNKQILRLMIFSLILSVGCASQPVQSVSVQELDTLRQEIDALKAENQRLKGKATSSALKEKVIESLETLFTDLDDELSTTPLVRDLATLGLFEKTENNQFNPYDTITRAEYVTWLYKAHNTIAKTPAQKIQLAPAFDPGFTDLDKNHPAYKYIASIANAGYSIGYDDKTFKPDQPITREEMLVIKVGIDKGKTMRPETSQMAYVWKFSDSKQVDPRYTGYIHADYYVSNPNIHRCFGKISTLKPQQPVLRHEAAASLWQFGDSANITRTTAEHALARKEEPKTAG